MENSKNSEPKEESLTTSTKPLSPQTEEKTREQELQENEERADRGAQLIVDGMNSLPKNYRVPH
jgi:hypothetical protein